MSLWNPKNLFQENVAKGAIVILALFFVLPVLMLLGMAIILGIEYFLFENYRAFLRESVWGYGSKKLMNWIVPGVHGFLVLAAIGLLNRAREKWNAPDDRLGGAENVDD